MWTTNPSSGVLFFMEEMRQRRECHCLSLSTCKWEHLDKQCHNSQLAPLVSGVVLWSLHP